MGRAISYERGIPVEGWVADRRDPGRFDSRPWKGGGAFRLVADHMSLHRHQLLRRARNP